MKRHRGSMQPRELHDARLARGNEAQHGYRVAYP